jgi:sulfide dehydrogenase [flavocytochrome c] flavoprotein subunit
MTHITRRKFLTLAGGTLAMGSLGFPYLSLAGSKHVVVVGGGIGGATAAKYIRMADASIDVTIIEPNKYYYTCFMSNEVLAGHRDINSIKFGYDSLKDRGIKVIHELATGIDPVARKVTTSGGKTLSYDRCIVSPGVDFKWGVIEGYTPEASEKMPHAWKAGPQTVLLRKQIEAMPDGGTMLIVAPPNPFRCPPGPYERACQVGSYFKEHKPKSKILVLDAKPKFSKFGLFQDAWERHYGYRKEDGMIDWISGPGGGKVTRVDPKTMTVEGAVDFQGDVINVIPPQQAGKIAFAADLVDESGWCPIKDRTFESTRHKDIYVVGDASIAGPLPKSGYAANSEAKVCAAAVVASLNGQPAPVPSWVNTCYSLVTPDEGISVAMVYRLDEKGKISKIKGSGGLTPKEVDPVMREREARYAHSWFKNVTHDTFG